MIHNQSLTQPLLLGDLSVLQRKLDGAGGLLGRYWDDFRGRMLADDELGPGLRVLPAVLTGEGVDEVCDGVLDGLRRLATLDTNDAVQFHTWCMCGAVLRQALHFDWLASREVWTKEQTDLAAEILVSFAQKHPLQVLTSRTRTSNNQPMSMALCCAVIGVLFGYKHRRHSAARHLLERGLGWFCDLIGTFPTDGYGGEGSTYTSDANTPLACWMAEFARQVAGVDLLDTPMAPNGTTLRGIIEMEPRLTSPGGLMAPWDNYGWKPAINASPMAYLARETGDGRYLSFIEALNLWPGGGQLAWGQDDPIWTLVWWPEELKAWDKGELPADLFGWFLPRTGAALDDCDRRCRLMQVWDATADTMATMGRWQTDPNHVMFDWDGEPIFQDGTPTSGANPWRYLNRDVMRSASQEERARLDAYARSWKSGRDMNSELANPGAAMGVIGAANTIVVDEEPWYWPGRTCVGEPLFYARADELQLVSADAGSFYRPHYDVRRARRTSLWTAAGFGVIVDTLEADTVRRWRWQTHLRPNVCVEDSAARICLPDNRAVMLAWTPVEKVRESILEGYPDTQEKRCCRLELLASGKQASFAVVVAPGCSQASIERLDAHLLRVVLDDKMYELVVDNDASASVGGDGASTSAMFAWREAGSAWREAPGCAVGPVRPDVHVLPDIDVEHETPVEALRDVMNWTAEPVEATPQAATIVRQMDRVFDQYKSSSPDWSVLESALRAGPWPVQVAAAEVMGRMGDPRACPALRERLAAECSADGAAQAEDAKRWRLKAAIIVALGRLRDVESVEMLASLADKPEEFYVVYSVTAQALGRIGGDRAVETLQRLLAEPEMNTRLRAQAGLEAITRRSSAQSER